MITLSTVPKHHPECCLSFSEALFTCLARCFTEITESAVKETAVLSIGCGTGFIEAALYAYLQKLGICGIKIEGVEVASADVRHLQSELVYHVPGTRSICQRASTADVLLFIYPREGELIRQYLIHFSSNVRLVLWLGPRADWMIQRQILQDISPFDGPHEIEDAGLAAYEVAVVFHNQTAVASQNEAMVTSQRRTQPQMKQDVRYIAGEDYQTLELDSI